MALVATLVLVSLVAAVGTLLVVQSLQPARPSTADIVDLRLDAYEGSLPPTLDEIELQRPAFERLVLPLLDRVAAVLANSTAEKQIQETQRRLNLAGRPGSLSAVDFVALRYVVAILAGALGLGLGLLLGKPPIAVLMLAGGAVFGLVFPGLWLSRRVRARQEEIRTGLPDAIDLLIVSVEAGLTFEAALAKVAEKYANALGEEFARVLQETRLGRGYMEALNDLGQRCEVDELQNFVQAVTQSQQLGGGIARILRVQAEEMRQKRLQRAQEKGAQASIKMLLPMIGCIFPTIWIVLLGPALLIVIHIFWSK
jgi:tight adherence protein C